VTFNLTSDAPTTMTWREILSVRVVGIPKAQPRARAFARNFGGKVSARMYDPGTVEAWKSDICRAFEQHWDGKTIYGPVSISIRFLFPRPKWHYRGGKYSFELKPGITHFHTSKPDRDNCEKAVTDCLTRLGLWKDDGQVCAGEVVKLYAAADQQAGAEIVVSIPALSPAADRGAQ
jgi:Holliday junction resolvase RusA-like endonuclease